MAVNYRKYYLPILIWSIFSLSGCGNDIFGMYASTDLDTRWQARNTFNFLSPNDLNFSLGDTYSFIVLTDTHIYNGNTHGLERLKDAIDDDVKFAVFTGDITQNGNRGDVKAFIEIARSLGVPCYPVLGNHDIFFGHWPEWKELIGSTCYRIDGGDSTFLIMDSANAYFGAKQLDWLEDELRKTTGRVFVFSHNNLFMENLKDIRQLTDTRERARVISLLKGRCDGMFMGHAHTRMIREFGGVAYIAIEDYRENAAYCRVWVSQDNVRWEFRKL